MLCNIYNLSWRNALYSAKFSFYDLDNLYTRLIIHITPCCATSRTFHDAILLNLASTTLTTHTHALVYILHHVVQSCAILCVYPFLDLTSLPCIHRFDVITPTICTLMMSHPPLYVCAHPTNKLVYLQFILFAISLFVGVEAIGCVYVFLIASMGVCK